MNGIAMSTAKVIRTVRFPFFISSCTQRSE
jgi:hypothetical protein